MSEEYSKKIAALNDRFRSSLGMPPGDGGIAVPGRIAGTRGIAALSPKVQAAILERLQNYKEFTEDNDPNGEHEFGAFTVPGLSETIFWKTDYYAGPDTISGSDDPADPAQSFRVLTIMLASEH